MEMVEMWHCGKELRRHEEKVAKVKASKSKVELRFSSGEGRESPIMTT